MIGTEDVRRALGTQWPRIAVASLGAAVAVVIVFSLFSPAPPLTVLQHSLAHTAVTAGLAGLVVPRVARRMCARAAGLRWAALVPLLLGLAVAGTLLACGGLVLLGVEGPDGLRACFADDLRVNALVTLAVGTGLTAYATQRRRLEEATLALRTRELEAERARKAALEARLASLESRVHPHFLFNTLNAISALVHDDPDRAERTVERLAALLRFSLDASGRGVVPVADELRIVGDYLEIERTRFGDRLAYAVDVEPAVRHWTIPPLAIQTLVENSVKHAIAPRPAGGRIHVAVRAAGDRLVVTVWDDGPGFAAAAVENGHGVDTLRGRLTARYGPAATFDVTRSEGGTLVTVSLPARDGA
jgi:two-component system sensor histidine kinase AlgZ